MDYNGDHITIEAIRKFNFATKINALYDDLMRGRSGANLLLIMPAKWWKEEERVCGYFGFKTEEIEYAETSPSNYIGTKNGFDCYVRI